MLSLDAQLGSRAAGSQVPWPMAAGVGVAGRGSSPSRGPGGGRRLSPAPPRALPRPGARSREAAAAAAGSSGCSSIICEHPRATSGGAGRTDRRTQDAQGARPAGAGHGGSLIWRRPRGGRPGPRELRAATPDPAAGRILGVLHRGLRPHHQRRLRERWQRPRAALRLQRERGRLPLRRRAGPRGLPGLRRLPDARPALPADQQRPRPPPRGAAGPGLLRALVLPVVRGLLFPHQPVAAHGARAGPHAGGRRSALRHRLQLLFHPQLGGAHCEGPAAVPPGHRHVSLCHRPAGRRCGPGLSRVPGGQRSGRHGHLPEPAFHRDAGQQPQRLPGACLLVAGPALPELRLPARPALDSSCLGPRGGGLQAARASPKALPGPDFLCPGLKPWVMSRDLGIPLRNSQIRALRPAALHNQVWG